MSTSDIEKIAIHIIEDQVLEYSECLSTYINSNDKTPFWDGMIYVYDNRNKTRNDFKNKIDVQIKGRKVTKFKENNTYKIDIEYLKGYQKEVKGTLLFVVDFIDKNNYKIYYRNLLPVDLYEIFNNIKGTQKTISLKLKEIDNSSPLNFKNVCINFYKNSLKQAGKKIIEVNGLENIKEISTEVFVSKNDYEYYIENGDVYTYVKLNDDEELPTIKANFKNYKNYNFNVSINNKIYYNNITFIGLNLEKVIIGPITLKLSEKKMAYKIDGTPKQRIKALKFLIDLFQNKYFNIKDSRFDFPFADQKDINEKIKLFNKRLEYFKKIEKVFKIFKTDFDIDYNNLSSKDIKSLHLLLNMHDGNFKEETEKIGKYIITINKYNFLVLKFNNKIMNYYSQEVLDNIVCFTSADAKIKTSIYSNIVLEEILNINNFDEKIVYKSFKKIDMKNGNSDIINLVALTFIKAYDEVKKDKYLKFADKLLQLVSKYKYDDINVINSKQVKYRKRNLTSNDKMTLKEISIKDEYKENYQLQCSIDILLGNDYSYEEHYKLMSAIEKKEFKEFPIYNLKKFKN